MTLITGHKAIAEAVSCQAAVAAFNIFNLESILAVADAAAETGAPVFCQISHSAAAMYGWKTLADAVLSAAHSGNAQIALHLDHGQSVDDVARALDLGFTSIMYDGSAGPLEENIATTRRVIAMCADRNMLVEGEVGVIGAVKSLDSQPVSDVEEVCAFVEATACDLVAIAIGNAHGFYASEPKLRFDTLAEVAACIPAPVVLHGASGISDANIRRSIELGVRKINYATELRASFVTGYKAAGEIGTDPRPALQAGREAIKEFCVTKIRLLGWAGN